MNGSLADFRKLDPKPLVGKLQNNSNCMHTHTHTPEESAAPEPWEVGVKPGQQVGI